MAQVREVRLVDDRDGSDAEESFTFSIDGQYFEIDLNAKHAQAFRESWEEWVEFARRVKAGVKAAKRVRKTVVAHQQRTPAVVGREQTQAIREWANANGFSVKDRGRIPAKVVAAFVAAH